MFGIDDMLIGGIATGAVGMLGPLFNKRKSVDFNIDPNDDAFKWADEAVNPNSGLNLRKLARLQRFGSDMGKQTGNAYMEAMNSNGMGGRSSSMLGALQGGAMAQKSLDSSYNAFGSMMDEEEKMGMQYRSMGFDNRKFKAQGEASMALNDQERMDSWFDNVGKVGMGFLGRHLDAQNRVTNPLGPTVSKNFLGTTMTDKGDEGNPYMGFMDEGSLWAKEYDPASSFRFAPEGSLQPRTFKMKRGF